MTSLKYEPFFETLGQSSIVRLFSAHFHQNKHNSQVQRLQVCNRKARWVYESRLVLTFRFAHVSRLPTIMSRVTAAVIQAAPLTAGGETEVDWERERGLTSSQRERNGSWEWPPQLLHCSALQCDALAQPWPRSVQTLNMAARLRTLCGLIQLHFKTPLPPNCLKWQVTCIPNHYAAVFADDITVVLCTSSARSVSDWN